MPSFPPAPPPPRHQSFECWCTHQPDRFITALLASQTFGPHRILHTTITTTPGGAEGWAEQGRHGSPNDLWPRRSRCFRQADEPWSLAMHATRYETSSSATSINYRSFQHGQGASILAVHIPACSPMFTAMSGSYKPHHGTTQQRNPEVLPLVQVLCIWWYRATLLCTK